MADRSSVNGETKKQGMHAFPICFLTAVFSIPGQLPLPSNTPAVQLFYPLEL